MNTTILLVDDHEDIRLNVTELLTLTGYKVIVAVDGKDGIDKAKSHHPDLILCDIMMPNIDGWGVRHILRKDASTKDIPFIFLTAKSESTDLRTALKLDAYDYIIKPFEANELLNAIENALTKNESAKGEDNGNNNEPSMEMPPEISTNSHGVSDSLSHLVMQSDLREYKKGQTIYKAGSTSRYLYYIQKGRVKTYKVHEEGKTLVIDLYGEGDFFGHTPLIEEIPYADTAEATEETEVALILKKKFEELLYSDPQLMKKFIRLLAKNIIDKDEQLIGLAYNTLRKKVANALVSLSKKYNKSGNEKFIINLNRDELAAIAGTATESLIRTLTDFKNEKLIDMNNGLISIISEKKLEMLIR